MRLAVVLALPLRDSRPPTMEAMRFRRAPQPPDAVSVADEVARLTASRRVIVDAYEIERRRIERDLHDGTQQYLVAASMSLGAAELSPLVQEDEGLTRLLRQAHTHLDKAMDALRTTVRGIHPQVLTDMGLVAALEDAARHSPQPVALRCPNALPALPEGVLACAYFFTTEALTNAAKHAPHAEVDILITANAELRVAVLDQGPGGASLIPGRGLAGISERLAAFGGSMWLSSPPGGPTQLVASIPLLLFRGESGIVVEREQDGES